MRIAKVVAFKAVFIGKLKWLFRSSEGYLKPGRISTIKLLAVNIFPKKVCGRYSTGFEIHKFLSFLFEPHSVNLCMSF